MTDRSDRKLQQVPLASFNYRHEAEFAAGFLQDAGIPYRLQIEDPAMGLSVTNSATLWVAAMDERKARQVLDHELEVSEDEEDWADDDQWSAGDPDEGSGGAGPGGPSSAGAAPARSATGRPSAPVERSGPPERGIRNAKPDLTLRQRVLALGGGVGVSAILGIEAVREASMGVPVGVALVAMILVLAGVFGWAPGPLRRLLGALSGDAP